MRTSTAWKVSKYGVFSDPYFPAFGLSTERYSLFLRIQSEYGKIRTTKNSVFGHFSHSAVFTLVESPLGKHLLQKCHNSSTANKQTNFKTKKQSYYKTSKANHYKYLEIHHDVNPWKNPLISSAERNQENKEL